MSAQSALIHRIIFKAFFEHSFFKALQATAVARRLFGLTTPRAKPLRHDIRTPQAAHTATTPCLLQGAMVNRPRHGAFHCQELIMTTRNTQNGSQSSSQHNQASQPRDENGQFISKDDNGQHHQGQGGSDRSSGGNSQQGGSNSNGRQQSQSSGNSSGNSNSSNSSNQKR
jgi:hypothetical protein